MMQRVFLNRLFGVIALGLMMLMAVGAALGQSTSGSVSGTVTDPGGALVPGASVVIANRVSGYSRTAVTDSSGNYHFANLPFDAYNITVTDPSFTASHQQVQISSTVPVTLGFQLQVGSVDSTVTVESTPDTVEQAPTFHTDVDRSEIDHLPVESPSSQLSSIVTLASPGVAADSNGQMHGLGDHAENSFSLDGEPITDQQSKVFSNSVPA